MKKFVRRFIAIFTAMVIAAMLMVTNVSAYYSVTTVNGIETLKGAWKVDRYRTSNTTYYGATTQTDYVNINNEHFDKNKSILQVSCTSYSSTVSSTNGPAYAQYNAFVHKVGKEDIVYSNIVSSKKFYKERKDDTYYCDVLVRPNTMGITFKVRLVYPASSVTASISGTYKII